VIYIFEVRLKNERHNLHPIVECVEGKDINEAKKRLIDKYDGDWKVDKATPIGSRKNEA
jgi:hypothetical protein